MKEQFDKRHVDDAVIAGDAFRATLVPRADYMQHGQFPMWHGWALMDAFIAGAAWQAIYAEAPQAVNPARIDTAPLEDTAGASAPSHVEQRVLIEDTPENRKLLDMIEVAPPGSMVHAIPSTTPQKPRHATALLDLMREHADYMASYSGPFVGSTEAIARYLRQGADYIEQLERELAQANADLAEVDEANTRLARERQTTPSATPSIDPRMLMLIRVLDDLEVSGNGWNPTTLPHNANEAERKFRDMLATNWQEIRRLIPIRRPDGGKASNG